MPMTMSRPASRFLMALLAMVLVVLTPTLAAAPSARAAEAPTPAPAPPAYELGDRMLRQGAQGPDVLALQKLLRVKRTGTFDVATRRAVENVQRAAGLKPVGVVGPTTLRAVKMWSRGYLSVSRGGGRAAAPAASQRYAANYISFRYGWGKDQFSCLKPMWQRESNWRYWVSNPNGIYRGIPQTSSRVWGPLGYTTAQYMASPEIQVRVGAHYIKKRYGTPCRAWAFWRSHHWY